MGAGILAYILDNLIWAGIGTATVVAIGSELWYLFSRSEAKLTVLK